jgi:hypothetical protein
MSTFRSAVNDPFECQIPLSSLNKCTYIVECSLNSIDDSIFEGLLFANVQALNCDVVELVPSIYSGGIENGDTYNAQA